MRGKFLKCAFEEKLPDIRRLLEYLFHNRRHIRSQVKDSRYMRLLPDRYCYDLLLFGGNEYGYRAQMNTPEEI